MKNMITNANKLFADYESDHIVMIYPHMYQKTYFYNNLLDIYKRLIDLFNINNIEYTVVTKNKFDYMKLKLDKIHSSKNTIEYECDDIWVRDYFPKIYIDNNNKKLINYDFNSYGYKYSYTKEVKLKNMFEYQFVEAYLDDIVLEGGNLEFSSEGVILTNMNSILKNNKSNNNQYFKDKLLKAKNKLEVSELFIFDVPEIIGDDTNGHIDNLVRFIDSNTILYFASKDASYQNYQLACKLEEQIENIMNKSKIIKNAIPIYHDKNDEFVVNNKIYPYSKLNFIATKNMFIFPCLEKNKNSIELQIKSLPMNVPLYTVKCEAALLEYGGLHCLTANI